MGAFLRANGFSLDGRSLRAAGDVLVAAVRDQPSATVVVAYAGHGLQWDGENYLLGVDAPLADDSPAQTWLSAGTLHLRVLLSRLGSAGRGQTAVLLNACRDNPWSEPERQGPGAFPTPDNMLIAYASAPGTVAYDRFRGSRLSPFFGALLAELEEDATRPLSEILPQVRARVSRATDGEQTPWERRK